MYRIIINALILLNKNNSQLSCSACNKKCRMWPSSFPLAHFQIAKIFLLLSAPFALADNSLTRSKCQSSLSKSLSYFAKNISILSRHFVQAAPFCFYFLSLSKISMHTACAGTHAHCYHRRLSNQAAEQYWQNANKWLEPRRKRDKHHPILPFIWNAENFVAIDKKTMIKIWI